jgi:hypothetical protein
MDDIDQLMDELVGELKEMIGAIDGLPADEKTPPIHRLRSDLFQAVNSWELDLELERIAKENTKP